MAKASEADMNMAFELANALESINSQWGATMPVEIADPHLDDPEIFSLDSGDDCRRVCEYLIRLNRSASLMRVVMGVTVLLDPRNKLVDPNSDMLEHHPDTVRALEAMGKATGGAA